MDPTAQHRGRASNLKLNIAYKRESWNVNSLREVAFGDLHTDQQAVVGTVGALG